MMGKHHVACNFAMLSGILVINQELHTRFSTVDLLARFGTESFGSLPAYVTLPLSLGLFWLGSLLPDIDSKKSILGKFLHLPVKHRGVTHSVWALSILSILTLFCNPLFWLTLGYFLHILMDSLSAGGICWLYPIQKYREYPGGAKVAPGHWLKLYRTGETSEVVITILFCAVLFGASLVWLLYQRGIL